MKTNYDVIVIGGGPGGSSIATLLQRKGWDVVLFEKAKFPRYHIGESLVPGCVPVLQELGVFKEMDEREMQRKYGITFVWGEDSTPWHVRWDETPSEITKNYTFQVNRSDFDSLLLKNAKRNGVEVHESTPVVSFIKEGNAYKGVTIKHNSEKIDVYAKIVIDASGQTALIGNLEKTFEIDEQLKNQAVWSYFENAGREDGENEGNIIIESSEIGWLWYIPFSNNVTSVGWVAGKNQFDNRDLSTQYFDRLEQSSLVKKLLSDSKNIDKVHTMRDWSYSSSNFYGNGYVLLGDAAGFVDPLFSTGVFLAMNGATLGAKCIDKALRNEEDKEKYLQLYEQGYKSFLKKVTDFVHFFYDASLQKDKYFGKADTLVNPFVEMTHRQEFIYLISGLAGINTFEKEVGIENE